ncbi:MAG: YqaA family protein [Mariprofundaceae bacterium]|nr:YqaA family protein [Mariprofundaceae bacterium]
MLLSLFIASFVASTLLPGGSEALLLYGLDQGYSAWLLCLVAGTGNVLGSIVTYLIGSMGCLYVYRRYLGIKEKWLTRAQVYFDKYGAWTLLFAWLPIIGDPICLLAGMLRYPFFIFVLLIAIGKYSRYALLCWGATSFA